MTASELPAMTPRQRLTIVATGLGMFMVFLDALIVNVALPDIQTEFGVGEAGAQAVVTAYSIGMAITIMWSATLADLRGRRRVYVGAAVVFGAASAVCGLAPGFAVLVVGRAVQGLAAGPITVASLALVSAAFSDDRARTKAVGLWTGVGAIGMALGPSLGGVLADVFGWRSVFFVNLPIAAALVVMTLAFVAESKDPSDRTFDYEGQVAFGVAVATFAAGVIAAPQQGWLSPGVLGLLAVAAISLALFVRRELRVEDPMMDLRLFSNLTYSLALVALFVFFFIGYGTLLIITQYFQNVRNFSTLDAGLLILPFALGFVIVAPLADRIAARVGHRRTMIGSLAGISIGLALLAVGLLLEPWVVSLGLFVVASNNAMAVIQATSLAMSSVTSDKSGMASGIMGTQRALGSTTGYAVMGSVLALWVGARLDDELRSAVPEASERSEIETLIVDQANPSAFVAEVGPRQPLGVVDATERADIVQIADDVFVNGMQLALAVGIGLALATLVAFVVLSPTPATGDGADRTTGPSDDD